MVDVQRLDTEWKIGLTSLQKWSQKTLARRSKSYFEVIHSDWRKDHVSLTRENFKPWTKLFRQIYLFHFISILASFLYHFWLVLNSVTFFVIIENSYMAHYIDNNKIKLYNNLFSLLWIFYVFILRYSKFQYISELLCFWMFKLDYWLSMVLEGNEENSVIENLNFYLGGRRNEVQLELP